MPFLLIALGFLIAIAAVRGTHRDLGDLVKSDFTGEGNFFVWLIAIGIVGSIGYYSPARGMSRAFLGLLLVVMLLSNKGFFGKLTEAFANVQAGASAGSGAAGNTLAAQTPEDLQARGIGVIQGWSRQGASEQQIADTTAGVVKTVKTVTGIISNPIAAVGNIFKGFF